MLVLTRRCGEVINIYPQEGAVKISVQILGVSGNQVRVGIDAPPGVEIVREEIEGAPRKPKQEYVRITVEELDALRGVVREVREVRALAVQGRRHTFSPDAKGMCKFCGGERGNPIHT